LPEAGIAVHRPEQDAASGFTLRDDHDPVEDRSYDGLISVCSTVIADQADWKR
jgi:hypothetical protein